MSDLRQPIYTLLTGDVAVSALVGTKVYPTRAPQDKSAPYIVWHVLNVEPYGTKSYASNSGASKVDRFTVQFDCVGDTYTVTTNIGKAVRDAIDRYAHGTVASVALNGIDFSNETDTYDDEMELHIKHLEFFIRRKN